MKHIGILLVSALALLCVWCTKVNFDNPLDAKGSNYVGDDKAGDHDGDGVPNIYDEDFHRVMDTTPPVITFVGGDTVLFRQNDPERVLARDTAGAMDDFAGNLSKDIEIVPGIFTSECGVQVVTYRVSDKAENTAQKQRVIIVDCEAPVITLGGENPMNLRVGGSYTEPGATAVDNIDGSVAANKIIITGTVRTTTERVDTVTYTTTDRAGNTATKKRIVIVTESPDNEPPVIALKGANPLSLQEGTPYVEPGWTVTDNRDTDLQDKVEVTGGPVNTTVPGRDTLTYKVTDKAGNPAEARRIIIVTPQDTGVDKIPPDLQLKGLLSMEVKVGEVYTEPGWTAIDNRDGDVTSKVVVTELFNKPLPVVTTAPTTYNLVYTVIDKAGNKAEVSREVKIVGTNTDVTPPDLRLEGKVKDTVKLGSTFVDQGATATDDNDGVISDKIVKVYKNAAGATVQATALAPAKDTGNFTITYSVSDAAGNPATPAIRYVYVKDTFIDPNNLPAKYGVPLAAALPTISKEYGTGGITTDGTGAPSMTTVTKFTINWDLANKGLYQFSLNLTVSPHYVNLSPTHTFGSASPGFTLTGSGITGLDGDYYIKADATQCVWVKKDGTFAIIFK